MTNVRRRVRFVSNRLAAAGVDAGDGCCRRERRDRHGGRRVQRQHLADSDSRRRRHRLLAASFGSAAVVNRRMLRTRLVHRLAARHPGVIGLRVAGAGRDARHAQRDDDGNSNENSDEGPHRFAFCAPRASWSSRRLETQPHAAVDVAAVERRPGIDGPAAIDASTRAEQRIPPRLSNAAEVFHIHK